MIPGVHAFKNENATALVLKNNITKPTMCFTDRYINDK